MLAFSFLLSSIQFENWELRKCNALFSKQVNSLTKHICHTPLSQQKTLLQIGCLVAQSSVYDYAWNPSHSGVATQTSSSLTCPVIRGRRYSWLASSSMLPCLLCCPLSAPPLSYLSYHSSHYVLIIHSHHRWPYNFSRFSVIFLKACTILVVPLTCSFRILSLRVTPHIHLSIVISFTSNRAQFLSSRCCPGFSTIQHSWSDHSFVNLPLQFHWHPPVTQHSTASLPVSPCCTHSLWNFCCHASCILHAWTDILKMMHSLLFFP